MHNQCIIIDCKRFNAKISSTRKITGNCSHLGILAPGVDDLVPQANRKRVLQVFDQIVYVFYSDGYADKVCW